MPVSTGRVSSREAERATREMVCTNASAGSVTRVSGVGLRKRGEVLSAEGAQMESGGSRDQLDILLRARSSSVNCWEGASGRHLAAAVPEEPRRQEWKPWPAERASRSPCLWQSALGRHHLR